MVAVKLLKEPGYVYDLNFIFYLNFNYKSFINSLPKDERRDASIEFFDSVLQTFGDVDEDLFVFFHSIENGRCFLTTKYILDYSDTFTAEYSFKYFLQQLRDRDTLVRNMIRFYFSDLSEEEMEACFHSKDEIFARIKASDYSGEEKSKLYEFFFAPDDLITLLCDQLISKEALLSHYYEKNYQKIFDVFNETTFESLEEQMEGLGDFQFLEESEQILYTSYCLLHKFLIQFFPVNEGVVFILGQDYRSILEFAKERSKEPSLSVFGSALAEENRIKIVTHLLDHEECTCKNFEKVFNFSGSTVYHHVTILLKAGVLKTRNEGKTILYSLNREHFDSVMKVLDRFTTKY